MTTVNGRLVMLAHDNTASVLREFVIIFSVWDDGGNLKLSQIDSFIATI